ncbi:MAG: helix-turn-helix transcriptional regulator [Pyramidobacter sp.]|nr:helix-turn-helix transcriptional regulator [Pyramidobacter sp.]MBP3751927.1 helix-turn-helix transcriptional regulator [Pyramidobacter sp.]
MTDEEIFDARMIFAGAVRRARLDSGMSLVQVAQKLLCCRPMVLQFESDGLTPTSKYFWRLCELFKLKPDSFGFDDERLEMGKKRAVRTAIPTTRKSSGTGGNRSKGV